MKQSIHQQIRDSRLTQTSLQDFFAGEGRSSLSRRKIWFGKYGLENMACFLDVQNFNLGVGLKLHVLQSHATLISISTALSIFVEIKDYSFITLSLLRCPRTVFCSLLSNVCNCELMASYTTLKFFFRSAKSFTT